MRILSWIEKFVAFIPVRSLSSLQVFHAAKLAAATLYGSRVDLDYVSLGYQT